METIIRPFDQRDRNEVKGVFLRNVPEFFAAEEIKDLDEYLDSHSDTYFVVQQGSKIVGAGGVHYPDQNTGRLSWDFFHPDYKGQGHGRLLIEHCLSEIADRKSITIIEVWTSQLAYTFYAKFGFKTEKVTKDFWGKGLDLYLMKMPPTNRIRIIKKNNPSKFKSMGYFFNASLLAFVERKLSFQLIIKRKFS